MKNKIILDKDDNKEEYNILFKVETDQEKENYVVYTKGEKNFDGETIAYAGKYLLKNGKQKIEPIEDDYTLEFLDSILLQVQKNLPQEEGEK